jgi:hypothetical protein
MDSRPTHDVRADVGVDAWIDCAGHLPWGQSGDLRFDDAASLTWDWDAEGQVLMGHPRVRLRVSSTEPSAYLSVKLCDVFPDGTSALVSRGTLNLGCRQGLDHVEPLVPGDAEEVVVELDACAYAFEPGHRLRMSVAGVDWPNTAAPPAPVSLSVHGGEVELPVWSGPSPFAAPVLAPGGDGGEDATGVTWRVERDVLAGTTACVVDHGSAYDTPYDGTAAEHYEGRASVDRTTFEQHSSARTTYSLRWPDIEIAVDATMAVAITADALDVSIDLDARQDGEIVATRTWEQSIRRRV